MFRVMPLIFYAGLHYPYPLIKSHFYTLIQVSLTPLRLFYHSIFHSRSDYLDVAYIKLLSQNHKDQGLVSKLGG